MNDNRPEWSEAEYTGAVRENAELGTKVLRVLAVDQDQNRTVTYSLARDQGWVQQKYIISFVPKT